MTGIFALDFGRFILASWCCIHFLGFTGWSLDVFRGIAYIMPNDRYFRFGFWTFFLASWCCIHFLGFAGRGLDVFREVTEIMSNDSELSLLWRYISYFHGLKSARCQELCECHILLAMTAILHLNEWFSGTGHGTDLCLAETEPTTDFDIPVNLLI